MMQALVIWVFLATVGIAPSLAGAAVEATCGVDRYEPNDQRSRAKSTRGKRVEARVCGEDADWYYVTLKAGSTVDIVVEHGPKAPVDVAFYPPRSRKPQGKVTRRGDTVTVRHSVTENGKHRIQVRSSGSPTAYGFEVKQSGG